MAEEKIDVDAQLSKLADENLDTDGTKIDTDTDLKVEVKKDTEIDKDKLDEHKESSALGRKVKGLEDKFTSVEEKIDMLLDAGPGKIENDDTDIAGLDRDFIPTTRKELDEYMDKRDKEKANREKGYDRKYMTGFGKFKEEEDYDEVMNELKQNFNFKHTDNGDLDAEMNYLKASRAFYRKKLSGKSPDTPLKGKDPKGPLGVGSDGEPTIVTDTPLPKLDEYAKDFVSKVGMSDESVKKALNGKGRMGLTNEG